jgi:xanthine dehydrogenase YagR molybdenum-binding subunit
VTGRATYAADNTVPDMVYAALVGSTVARGTVENIDSSAAERHPDVLRVIADLGGVKLPFDPRQVASFDQPVAIVIGATSEAARHGAALVEVQYSRAAQVTDMSAPGITPEPNTRTPDYSRGNPEDALRAAAVVTDLRYAIERENHNAIELPATLARWDGDRLTVWDKVQGLATHQQMYAEALGVPVENVRIICPFVGGAFGSALKVWPHQLLASFAAREMGRPVKLVLSRKQTYGVVGYRPTSRQRLAIGADRAGRIGSIIHEVSIENSRYAQYLESITPYARSCTPLPTCARPLGWSPSTSILLARCAGQAPSPARTRWNARWTTWRTGSGWTPSSCGCATSPATTRSMACRSPPAA